MRLQVSARSGYDRHINRQEREDEIERKDFNQLM